MLAMTLGSSAEAGSRKSTRKRDDLGNEVVVPGVSPTAQCVWSQLRRGETQLRGKVRGANGALCACSGLLRESGEWTTLAFEGQQTRSQFTQD